MIILKIITFVSVVAYLFGVLIGLIAFVYHINDGDLKEFISAFGIERSMSNGAGILLALLLIPAWPLFVMRPLFKWLKEPMQ